MLPKIVKDFIEFDKRKCIVGCVFALPVFLICAIFYSWFAGAVFAAAFVVVGAIKIKIKNTKIICCLNGVYTLFCVYLTFFTACKLMYPDSFSEITFWLFNLNVLCILILCGVFYLLTANIKASVTISIVVLMILSLVNYFVFVFRDRELVPSDFLAMGTAMSVAGQYKLSLVALQSYYLIILGLCVFAMFSLPDWPDFSKKRGRIAMAVTEVVMIAVLCISSSNIQFRCWKAEGSLFNGYYLNFLLGFKSLYAEKPDGYSAEQIKQQSEKYDNPEKTADSLPNIIVIMNESYADFSIFGGEVTADQPITPYLDSLKENTIRGYALASVYGGNTANSEFEFLTGHSMAFMPEMSIPYQQYIKDATGSFVWLMKDYGFSTMATHPFKASGWDRNRVYPLLGFERSTFEEDYLWEDTIRWQVSDQEFSEYVLNALKEKEDGKPAFMFGITMQNHGGYRHKEGDYTKVISLQGEQSKYPEAEQYFTLIHETDKAMECFLTELEEYPEDTVVLFFGDHFPKVENEFFELLAGGPLDTLEEQMKQYTVPFFIWANYDIPEQEVELTSLNYLSRYLLDAAGIELPPYYQFLSTAEENVPAMNVLGYYSKSQKKFLTFNEAEGKEKEWINKYASAQYNNLFDTKNRDENFFAQYISAEE